MVPSAVENSEAVIPEAATVHVVEAQPTVEQISVGTAAKKVVAPEAQDRVISAETLKIVVQIGPDDRVSESIADAGERAGAQSEVLDIGPRRAIETEASGAHDPIDPGRHAFEDEIGVEVGQVKVVTRPALHVVQAGPAAE